MTKKEAEFTEALIRRIDAQRAKIKRVEWALDSIRESAYEQMNKYAPEADVKLKLVDFIEKAMEG